MVTSASPKMISSAARPPRAPTTRAKICCLLSKLGSSPGRNHVRPLAWPRGIRVTCHRHGSQPLLEFLFFGSQDVDRGAKMPGPPSDRAISVQKDMGAGNIQQH